MVAKKWIASHKTLLAEIEQPTGLVGLS